MKTLGKNNTLKIVGTLFLLVAFVVIVLPMFGIQLSPLSTISIDLITYDDFNERFSATVVVDGFDTLFIFNRDNMISRIPQGKTFSNVSDLQINFDAQQNFCNFPLTFQTEPTGSTFVPYNFPFFSANNEILRTPYTVTINSGKIAPTQHSFDLSQ